MLGAGKSDVPSLLGGKRHSPVNFIFSQGWYSLRLAFLCLTCVLLPSFSLGTCTVPAQDCKAMNNVRGEHMDPTPPGKKEQIFPQACYPTFLLFTPMNLVFIKHSFLWSSYREIIFPSLNVCCIFFFKHRLGFESVPKFWCSFCPQKAAFRKEALG